MLLIPTPPVIASVKGITARDFSLTYPSVSRLSRRVAGARFYPTYRPWLRQCISVHKLRAIPQNLMYFTIHRSHEPSQPNRIRLGGSLESEAVYPSRRANALTEGFPNLRKRSRTATKHRASNEKSLIERILCQKHQKLIFTTSLEAMVASIQHGRVERPRAPCARHLKGFAKEIIINYSVSKMKEILSTTHFMSLQDTSSNNAQSSQKKRVSHQGRLMIKDKIRLPAWTIQVYLY